MTVRPSPASLDLLGGGHRHHWIYEGFSRETCDGRAHGDALPPRPNAFTSAYNTDAGFRSFIRIRLEAGELSSEVAAGIPLLEDLEGGRPGAVQGRLLLEAFFGKAR